MEKRFMQTFPVICCLLYGLSVRRNQWTSKKWVSSEVNFLEFAYFLIPLAPKFKIMRNNIITKYQDFARFEIVTCFNLKFNFLNKLCYTSSSHWAGSYISTGNLSTLHNFED